MPSTSKKQHNFMEAVAHNPSFAKKAGVPQSVGKDFSAADKGLKFGKGGVKAQPENQSVNQPKTNHGGQSLFKQGGRIMAKNSDAGNSTKMQKVAVKPGNINGVAAKGLTKGKVVKMAGNSIGNGAPVNTMKKGGMAKAMKKGGMAKC